MPGIKASAPVDIRWVADFDHMDIYVLIIDRIENAVGSLAYAVLLPPGELLARPAGVVCSGAIFRFAGGQPGDIIVLRPVEPEAPGPGGRQSS